MDLEKIKKINKLSELKDLNNYWYTYTQKDIDRVLMLNEAKKYESILRNINNKIELVQHIRTVIFDKMDKLNQQLIALENDLAFFSKEVELLETQNEYVKTRKEIDDLDLI